MSGHIYTRHAGAQTLAMLDELVDLYSEVQSGLLEGDDPLFSREQFISRTRDQASRAGFELLTVHADAELAGFSFGLPFAAGKWWAGIAKPPAPILNATKFAVIELNVLRAHRGQGLGRALLGNLLAGRHEAFAALATVVGSPAQAMYERWGWSKVGTFEDEGPLMDAMVTELRPEGGSTPTGGR